MYIITTDEQNTAPSRFAKNPDIPLTQASARWWRVLAIVATCWRCWSIARWFSSRLGPWQRKACVFGGFEWRHLHSSRRGNSDLLSLHSSLGGNECFAFNRMRKIKSFIAIALSGLAMLQCKRLKTEEIIKVCWYWGFVYGTRILLSIVLQCNSSLTTSFYCSLDLNGQSFVAQLPVGVTHGWKYGLSIHARKIAVINIIAGQIDLHLNWTSP